LQLGLSSRGGGQQQEEVYWNQVNQRSQDFVIGEPSFNNPFSFMRPKIYINGAVKKWTGHSTFGKDETKSALFQGQASYVLSA